MLMDPLSAIVGVGSAVARWFGADKDRDAQERAQQIQIEQAQRNEALQREFAQNSIRWKVEDAKAAGIHPMYALGAQGSSFSPVSVGDVGRTSMSDVMGEMGQDISRAVHATSTQGERDNAFNRSVEKLTLTNFALKNELLASQIAKLRQTNNPPMQGTVVPVETEKPSAQPILQMGGTPWKFDPKTSSMKDFSDRYGDDTAEWVLAPMIGWNDLKANVGQPTPQRWPETVSNAVWNGVKWIDKNIKVFGR